MSDLPERILLAIRGVIGDSPAGLHEPTFAGNERNYVSECIESALVSSIGPFVEQFESRLAEFVGAPFAIATSTGTGALHAALLVSGVAPGDEVLVPALSFVATANAVAYIGATPHFVDIEERTLGMSPDALGARLRQVAIPSRSGVVNRESGRRIRAVVPMHTFGHPCDMHRILEVASEFELAVVEDAAESLGSLIGTQHTGTFGQAGILSFNGNKTITTGGGGAILTADPELARQAKHITTTARVNSGWKFEHDAIGFNYRLPNLNAALGCAQLEQLPGFIESQRRLFSRYAEAFADLDGVRIFSEPQGSRSNYWLQTLLLDSTDIHQRDDVLHCLNSSGIAARPAWELLPLAKPYAAAPRAEILGAKDLSKRIINVPSSPGLA